MPAGGDISHKKNRIHIFKTLEEEVKADEEDEKKQEASSRLFCVLLVNVSLYCLFPGLLSDFYITLNTLLHEDVSNLSGSLSLRNTNKPSPCFTDFDST